jgi:hypothetical protein
MKIFDKARRQERKAKRKARQEQIKQVFNPQPMKVNATIVTNNKKDMKFLKPAARVALSILKGFADVIFPNVKNTIKMSESEFKEDKTKKWEIDFPRLLAAVTVWIILLLVFFGKVKLEDVIDLIGRLL